MSEYYLRFKSAGGDGVRARGETNFKYLEGVLGILKCHYLLYVGRSRFAP